MYAVIPFLCLSVAAASVAFEPEKTLRFDHPISAMAISANRELIAFGLNEEGDGKRCPIQVMDLRNGKTFDLIGQPDEVLSLSFSKCGTMLCSVGFDGNIIVRDLIKRQIKNQGKLEGVPLYCEFIDVNSFIIRIAGSAPTLYRMQDGKL